MQTQTKQAQFQTDEVLLPDSPKPLALVVFLENIGHILGLNLPQWMMNSIDFVTEEYAKIFLRFYGAYRRYDQVIILEDEDANGPELIHALLDASRTHRVDVLLLVHGGEHCLIGYKGQDIVGIETFKPLVEAYQADTNLLDIRMVYGLNCHGITLASTWTALGAQVVNGAVGINWFPEPSLSVFLRDWLGGRSYSHAVHHSNTRASHLWRRILRPDRDGREHPWIDSSRQVIYGRGDLTIYSA